MTWADPFLLHLIALFPALMAIALVLWWRRRREVSDALGDPRLVARLTGEDLRAFPAYRAMLLIPAAALLGVAAAGPRWGSVSDDSTPRHGDVVLVLDASNSMLVNDVRPSRLERERAIARELVAALPGSRVGVVAFAGNGQVLTPLTEDATAVSLYLDALAPDVVHQGGSSLYAALHQAVTLLDVPGSGDQSGSIVVISDGEALEPEEMVDLSLEQAREREIRIHTIGVGTEAGGRVPDTDPATGAQRGFKRDPETGQLAVSRLNPELLRRIARVTEGTYTESADAGSIRQVAALAAAGGSGAGGINRPNRYAWFLMAALVLIALDALRERRPVRVREVAE